VAGELRGAASASAGAFQLQPGSGVARHPETFGIRNLGDHQPLAIDLVHEPRPSHAEEMRRELRSAVLSRVPFASQPLGIDAHTLFFLHHAGVSAMMTEPVAHESPLLRRGFRQTITESNVLYGYDADRAVKLSALAVWVLDRLEEPQTADHLARELGVVTGEQESETLLVVRQITDDLLERGLLIRA